MDREAKFGCRLSFIQAAGREFAGRRMGQSEEGGQQPADWSFRIEITARLAAPDELLQPVEGRRWGREGV